jgi:four helix bundle protein
MNFAVWTGKIVDKLPEARLGRHIAGQLVRSGTSPAPNYEEACVAESKADFIHKLGIVLKELRESRMWLRLIMQAELLPRNDIEPAYVECNELCNIIGQSRITARGIKQPPQR